MQCGGGAPRLPLAGARKLANLAHDEIAFDAAQPIDEQRAVKVIDLVLKRARQEPCAFACLFVAVAIESTHEHALRARNGGIESGNTEAALVFELHALT